MRARSLGGMLLAAGLVLLAGCGAPTGGDGGGATDASGPPPDPTVTAGTGAIDYEPLGEGDPLPIYAGPQGGYHAFGALSGQGLACPDATIWFRIYEGDGVTPLAETMYLDDLELVGAEKRYAGVALIFAAWGGAPLADALAELGGRPLVLEVEVTDVEGRTAIDSVALVGDCCN